MKTLALVTTIAATGHDEDMAPLLDACAQAGIHARAVAWDDATVSWRRFDAALLRSPWDYTERLPEFLAWCERVDAIAPLHNPLHVVRWNTDKHYLQDLAALGIPVVATRFVEADVEPLEALQAFLGQFDTVELVVKPAISAGARDTQRYARAQEFAASNHIARLLEENRSVMLQPYLNRVDTDGETALIYFDGTFSHAVRKAALLQPDTAATQTPFAAGDIRASQADSRQQALAEQVLEAVARLLHLDQPLTYARVDLIQDETGSPCLLELELTEPSLFFALAPDSAQHLAANLATRLASSVLRTRTGRP